jgi:hypothetical protein
MPSAVALAPSAVRSVDRKSVRKEAAMESLIRGLILLIPTTLASSFMLWVLWNFHKASRRR